MRAVIIVSIALVTLVTSTITNAQSRRKRDRSKQEQSISQDGYIDGNKGIDTRTQYFVDNVLATNDTSKIAEFIVAGVDVNSLAGEASAVRYYQSILMRALYRCKLSTVECLLQHGADPNRRIKQRNGKMFSDEVSYAYSMYPIEAAADANSVEKMQLLIKYGADMNVCMSSLKEIATQKGNMQMINFINGKSGTDRVEKNTLAVMTTFAYGKDFSTITPALITELAGKGADVNAYAPSGRTPLINVLLNKEIRQKIPLMQTLLKLGANPNKGDIDDPSRKDVMKFYSTTPLIYAVKYGWLDAVKVLVENGADVKKGDVLSRSNDKNVTEYLILHGAK